MKEIIYPQRLKETIVGKGNLSYIRTAHRGAPPPPPPPITCTPSTRDFINNPVNYNLVSKVDVNYEFYAIVEADGQRFFIRTAGNAVPTEPVIGKLYYDENDDYDSAANGDMTAAMAVDPFLVVDNITASDFNEDYYPLELYHPYMRFLLKMWYCYDVKPVQTPRESWSLTTINGFTVNSTLPYDFADDADELDLRLNPNPYSFKFCRATSSEIQQYGIVNTSSQRCINIIDYANSGNELEALSCAQISLPTSPNHDNVSLINCVEAPSEYSFTLQNIHNLLDTSGSIQITDSVTGFTKKYLFKQLGYFLESWLAIDMVRLDFPVYYSNAFLDGDQLVIMMEKLEGAPESYFNPLKIIIQMNSPNALFTNNGTNRLAFCLSVPQYVVPPPESNPNPEPEPINCIPDEFTIKAIDIADPNIKKVRMRCYLTVDGIPDDYWNFKPDNSEIGYIECSYTRPSTSKPIYGRDILFEYFNVNDFFGPAIHSFFYGTDTIVNGNLSKITLKGLTVNSNVGNPNEVRVDQAVVKLSFIPITDLASDEIDFTILQWGSEQTFHSCAKIVWIDEVT